MKPTPVIAIFDIGRTNKKLFLFNEQYQPEFERTARFTETLDEDGFPCESIDGLREFILTSLQELLQMEQYEIKAVNFTSYGASLVFIDQEGNPLTPLYNYLKPYPAVLKQQFYSTYSGEALFAQETASPVLGSLNSGMQLFRLKHQRPSIFSKVQYALHLPQYLSYLITGFACSDLTSIGCHTGLWDFHLQHYHQWTVKERIQEKLAPVLMHEITLPAIIGGKQKLEAGVGLHDSSAALIPYLVSFQQPFLLLSTGTWCISLHPFNEQPLTQEELQQDCLCYLSYEGKPVKASRLFAGQIHEEQVRRIGEFFGQSPEKYATLIPDETIFRSLVAVTSAIEEENESAAPAILFEQRDLSLFSDDVTAYHQLMTDIAEAQAKSTNLLLREVPVKDLYVDGGFSRNEFYMYLLSIHFPEHNIYAASVPQGTAIGAALAIHKSWNSKPIPENLIQLNRYRKGER